MRTTQRDQSTRSVTVQISGTGTTLAGTECIVTRISTGTYSVRFPGIFKALLGAVGSINAGGFISVTPTSPDVVGINTWASNVAPADIAFSLTVTGLPR